MKTPIRRLNSPPHKKKSELKKYFHADHVFVQGVAVHLFRGSWQLRLRILSGNQSGRSRKEISPPSSKYGMGLESPRLQHDKTVLSHLECRQVSHWLNGKLPAPRSEWNGWVPCTAPLLVATPMPPSDRDRTKTALDCGRAPNGKAGGDSASSARPEWLRRCRGTSADGATTHPQQVPQPRPTHRENVSATRGAAASCHCRTMESLGRPSRCLSSGRGVVGAPLECGALPAVVARFGEKGGVVAQRARQLAALEFVLLLLLQGGLAFLFVQ